MTTVLRDWYKTPMCQTILLGWIFFFVFAAYTTIQFYAASNYGPTLAANVVSVLYASFTAACFVAPLVTRFVGNRRTMMVGILGGYVSFVLVSLLYFQGYCSAHLVVLGGAMVGVGAALLWTAQGNLLLQYTEVAQMANASKDERDTKNSQGRQHHQGYHNKSQRGTLLGVFWAVFQCSSLVGGAISFVYYSHHQPLQQGDISNPNLPTGSTSLYVIFLVFMIFGGLLTEALLPASALRLVDNGQQHKQRAADKIDAGVPVKESLPSLCPTGFQEDTLVIATEETMLLPASQEDEENVPHYPVNKSYWSTVATHSALQPLRMLWILSLLFFYTGFNQPYQQATFTRFLSKRTIGLQLIVFHAMEIAGAIVAGRLLDRCKTNHGLSNRRCAILCLLVFSLINASGNMIALVLENQVKDSNTIIPVDISENWRQTLLPSLAFALWGWADAQIQVYCYWLLGELLHPRYSAGSSDFHHQTPEFSRAVAYYKCLQSLGYSVGFCFIPTVRLGAIHQLQLSSVVFVVGVVLSFGRLPPG